MIKQHFALYFYRAMTNEKNVVVSLKMKNHKGMQIEAIKFSSSEKRGTLSATMK